MSALNDFAQTVTAIGDTRFVLIGGKHLGRRYLDWNFVSSRKERVEQAKTEWWEGRFPNVVGDEDEFIPLPS